MINLFDDDRLQELRHEYQKSRLYHTLYPGLAYLERMYDELSPTQIWHEMEVFCAGRLMGAQALEMEVIDLWNSLLKRYSAFCTHDGKIINRSQRQAEYTAVCVMTCVGFRLVAEPDELSTWNSSEAVKEILKLISNHPVHCHLYTSQRKREQLLEDDGRMIDRVPWVDGVDSKLARNEIKKAEVVSDDDMHRMFNSLYMTITLEQWTIFVNKCEAEITFNNKIDRMAYLVMASHKNWLKGPKTIKLGTWVEMMNNLLGDNKSMQQAEVSRKWKEMKNAKFYESLYELNNCLDFKSDSISASFFKRLKENVKLMHQKYKSINNNQNNNG